MYVIDASVLVADARPGEPHHAQARVLMERLGAAALPVLLPTIVSAEVAGAISRGTGERALAHRLVSVWRRMPHFEYVPVGDELGDLAAELAADHRIRGCEASRGSGAAKRPVLGTAMRSMWRWLNSATLR